MRITPDNITVACRSVANRGAESDWWEASRPDMYEEDGQ